MTDQNSLEQAAKESAEKCQIKYGRDFTQAVDMFKRGAEWQSQHCVTDCVKEADTKAPEEWAKVKWATVIKAEGSIGKSYSPHDAAMLGAQRGFDAAIDLIARPLLKRCGELEAQLSEAKESANKWCGKYMRLSVKSDHNTAAMRDALEALERLHSSKAFHVATSSIPKELILRMEYAKKAAARLRERLEGK